MEEPQQQIMALTAVSAEYSTRDFAGTVFPQGPAPLVVWSIWHDLVVLALSA